MHTVILCCGCFAVCVLCCSVAYFALCCVCFVLWSGYCALCYSCCAVAIMLCAIAIVLLYFILHFHSNLCSIGFYVWQCRVVPQTCLHSYSPYMVRMGGTGACV